MAETENSRVDLQGFLLDRFTEDDFVSARSNLLERYTNFHGLLISEDGESILTPDDIDTFREHAADFTEQSVFSDYENEQLKILTVLIYQMLNAGKGIGNITGKKSKIKFWQTHGHFYILRKLFHQAHKLDFEAINKLIEYQNTLYKLYQRSKQISVENLESTTLLSRDEEYFVIKIENGEFFTSKTVPVSVALKKEPTKAKAKPKSKQSSRHIVFCDQEKDALLDTAKSTNLACGVKIAAASYIGVKRKANEDGIVVLPDNNQVTVIDGMGGYGNGAKARELFCQSVAKFPGEIDKAVIFAQKSYDINGLGKGGVCTMNIQIESNNDDDFEVDMGQAGDVHLLAFDEKFEVQYESIDEAIGHKVINAIMGENVTAKQRRNGWDEFGLLTHNQITVKKGWRVANFSDGIANHFDALTLKRLITNCTPKTAIGRLSSRLNKLMAEENAYKDNCSIAILDF